jgi:hypothetical protein
MFCAYGECDMMRLCFLWNMLSCTFVPVPEDVLKEWPNWSNGNYIIAHKDAPGDDVFWQFDINFGGAFGEEISGLVNIVKLCQGNLINL